MNAALIEQLKHLLFPLLSEMGAELFKLTLQQQGPEAVVDIFVDKPTGGITIEECSTLNRKFYALIESSQLLGEDFTLGISSPGLDWPMTTRRDFNRVVGRPIHIFLLESVAAKIEWEGQLEQVLDSEIVVRPFLKNSHGGDPKANTILIPLGKIRKAVQII